MTNTKKNGFTLIELIVVIAIIGVLAAILVPTMIGYVKKSKRAADVSSAKDIHTQVMDPILTEDYLNDSFYYDGGNVSSAISKLDEISNHTYDLVVVAYLDGAGKTDGSGNVWTPTDAGIQDFCDALGMSRSVVSKHLNAEVGLPAGQFIRNYRLNMAKELLSSKTGNRNITEIAYAVGFNDPKYFTRCFTKMFGMSPRAYGAN